MAKKPVKKTAAKKPVKKPVAKKAPAKKTAAKTAPAKKTGGLSSLFKPVKQSVTIRLDSDVVAWFKKQADKYQTEINSVLRGHASKKGM
jgi:uncharacterized protein (DUF4415 family)